MCKSKSSTKAINPSKKSNTNQPLPPFNTTTTSHFYSSSSTATTTTTTSSSSKAAASSSSSSHSSLSIARTALPNNPNLYSFSEISSATNNFLSKRLTSSSSSSSSWRCTLRRKDVVVVQRKLHRPLDQTRLHQLLSTISKIHHSSIVNLLGACPSTHHVFLVYEFAPGASLSTCLRTRINPSYTALSTWLSRIHIAADISDALRYIHHDSPVSAPLLVHNHVSSSSLIVSDDSLRARLCLLGAAQLSGEVGDSHLAPQAELRLQGKVGYIPPEFSRSGIISLKTDVYAFGVVLLELLSGREPLRSRYDKASEDIITVSLVDTVQEAIASVGDGGLRRWMDSRLKDSFPIDVAKRVTRIALESVHPEPDERPDMAQVAAKLSKLYLKSKEWSEKMRSPTEISVSMTPR